MKLSLNARGALATCDDQTGRHLTGLFFLNVVSQAIAQFVNVLVHDFSPCDHQLLGGRLEEVVKVPINLAVVLLNRLVDELVVKSHIRVDHFFLD